MNQGQETSANVEKALKEQLGHMIFTLTLLNVQLAEAQKENAALKLALEQTSKPKEPA